MTTLTIEISEKAGKTLADLVEQLGGKVISVSPALDAAKELTRKEKDFLTGLDESIAFVKQHRHEKGTAAKSIDELLDEL